MKFHFTADATFEADDLDDAFWLLRNHFHDLYNGKDSKLLDAPSVMNLQPLDTPAQPDTTDSK